MQQDYFDIIIGCYGSREDPTIQLAQFKITDNTWSIIAQCRGVDHPSYLCIHEQQDFVYAISEVEAGEIISYQINRSTNEFIELNRMKTSGAPCFIGIDTEDNILYTANYGNGSIVIHDINNDGSIGHVIAHEKFISGNNANTSKIHSIHKIPHTNYYVVVDIGLDRLYFYEFTSNRNFQFIRELEMIDGSGPRKVTFHPELNMMYVVNEYHQTILAYEFSINLKSITLLQVLQSIPENVETKSYGAEIDITPCGSFVYVSNRGHNSMLCLKVQGDGGLSRIGWSDIVGEWPRHFILLPHTNKILVANEHSNEIVVMIREESGLLQALPNTFSIENPACIKVC